LETEKRVKLIEEAIMMMKDLIIRHDERLDDFDLKINETRKEMLESREDFNFKLNALIDSQIRTGSDLATVKDSIIELRKTAESTLKRVEKIENKN
jgi:hypothetical protein